MTALKKLIDKFDSLDRKIRLHNSIQGLLSWDESTYMPKKNADNRAKQLSYMELMSHEMVTSKELKSVVSELKKKSNYSKLDVITKRKIDLYNKKISRYSKIPKSHVEEITELTSKLYNLWVEAKKQNSFKMVIPLLKRMFELKKMEAKYIDPKKKPYDIFLDDHEEGTHTEYVDKLFSELKVELIKILNTVSKSKNYEKINSDRLTKLGKFDEKKQWELSEDICSRILVYKDRYNLSPTAHPFMLDTSINDCRVTSAVRIDPMFSFGSTVHECGHGVFAMNLNSQVDGTILASQDAIGLALHESQSRFWENIICNSEYFWKGYYSKYQASFPQLKNISVDRFYKMINISERSLIRIEADELTYCLHIIIRYEIEKGIFENKIKVEDLEQVWNSKYKEYLGIVPDTSSNGVLQDVHWYAGLIGYFHTYALGNIYSGTIYKSILKDNPELHSQISKLDFDSLRNWLVNNIYSHAGIETTGEIIKNSCGKDLDIKDYISYLKDKYYKIYDIKE